MKKEIVEFCETRIVDMAGHDSYVALAMSVVIVVAALVVIRGAQHYYGGTGPFKKDRQ